MADPDYQYGRRSGAAQRRAAAQQRHHRLAADDDEEDEEEEEEVEEAEEEEGEFDEAYEALLRPFWAAQKQEVASAALDLAEFKNQQLPLARIKKIMKSDEDVRMISAEAPVLFAKACEMFILDLTLRGWVHAEDSRRRTLQRSDVAAAIDHLETLDFLTDIIPVEPEEGEAGGGGGDGPAAGGRGSARQAAAAAAGAGGAGYHHHQPGVVPGGGGGEAHNQLFSQWSAEGQAQQRGRR